MDSEMNEMTQRWPKARIISFHFDTALQTQNLKFEPLRSEAEHATSPARSGTPYNIYSLKVSGEETFCFFETWWPEWGSNPRSSTFQAGSFNHCTRVPPLAICHKTTKIIHSPGDSYTNIESPGE